MQLEIVQINELTAIPPRNILRVLQIGSMRAGRTLAISAADEYRFFFEFLYFFSHARHSTPALKLMNARSQSEYRQVERNQDSTHKYRHDDEDQRFNQCHRARQRSLHIFLVKFRYRIQHCR